MVHEVTTENIQKLIAENEILIIDFWAPWCGPCRQFGPIFEEIAKKNDDIAFAKLNTEAQPELAGEFGIRSIPTIGVFKDKDLIFLEPGALPSQILEQLVAQVRTIDMAQVRADAEKAKV